MKKTLLSFLISITFTSIQLNAQTVDVSGEIRSRGEFRDGFREPLADTLNPSFVNNLRTKINLNYDSEEIKARIVLIDSRTYGTTDVAKTGNGVGVLEAWGQYNFTSQFAFRLGRQGLEYDDKRLFSYNNWSNTPGAHDLLLLKYTIDDLTINVGSGFNNNGDSIQYKAAYTQSYKTLNYIWLSKPIGKISVSAIWVNDSFEKGPTGDVTKTYRNTVGGNIWLTNKKNPFTFQATGYYQFGRDKSNRSLRAYLLALTAQQKLNDKWAVNIGGDLFSGSKSNLNGHDSHTFNKLYGTNHAFNGSIEYWASLPSQGLIDLYVGATAKFSQKFDVGVSFHQFSTPHKINTDVRTNIGSEIDIVANYIVNKQFELQGGWSAYFATKATDILKKKVGVDTHFPQWAYIQVSFKPSFFSQKL